MEEFAAYFATKVLPEYHGAQEDSGVPNIHIPLSREMDSPSPDQWHQAPLP